MPKVAEQVLIPHSADNLYELVRDVQRYPDFIKWITNVRISDETGGPETPYSCVGLVTVRFKGFEERFSSTIQADPLQRRIDAKQYRGPFRHLRNRWQFDPREDGHTRVHCFIDYEFQNPVLNLLAQTNTRRAIERIITAFHLEADRRFGREIPGSD